MEIIGGVSNEVANLWNLKVNVLNKVASFWIFFLIWNLKGDVSVATKWKPTVGVSIHTFN